MCPAQRDTVMSRTQCQTSPAWQKRGGQYIFAKLLNKFIFRTVPPWFWLTCTAVWALPSWRHSVISPSLLASAVSIELQYKGCNWKYISQKMSYILPKRCYSVLHFCTIYFLTLPKNIFWKFFEKALKFSFLKNTPCNNKKPKSAFSFFGGNKFWFKGCLNLKKN